MYMRIKCACIYFFKKKEVVVFIMLNGHKSKMNVEHLFI